MSSLKELVAEAAWLAKADVCATGHDWEAVGGRECTDCYESQTVYECKRCGATDFGDVGGPAYIECKTGQCAGNQLGAMK